MAAVANKLYLGIRPQCPSCSVQSIVRRMVVLTNISKKHKEYRRQTVSRSVCQSSVISRRLRVASHHHRRLQPWFDTRASRRAARRGWWLLPRYSPSISPGASSCNPYELCPSTLVHCSSSATQKNDPTNIIERVEFPTATPAEVLASVVRTCTRGGCVLSTRPANHCRANPFPSINSRRRSKRQAPAPPPSLAIIQGGLAQGS